MNDNRRLVLETFMRQGVEINKVVWNLADVRVAMLAASVTAQEHERIEKAWNKMQESLIKYIENLRAAGKDLADKLS